MNRCLCRSDASWRLAAALVASTGNFCLIVPEDEESLWSPDPPRISGMPPPLPLFVNGRLPLDIELTAEVLCWVDASSSLVSLFEWPPIGT